MKGKFRDSGIEVIGNIPWGTYFCQFYRTKEDLIEVLVPYFKAGLENSEFCMWVTSAPLTPEEAKTALQKTVPGLQDYLEKGQIEILPYNDWYLKTGTFNSQKVLDGWVEKLDKALADGYKGLRVTGNTSWLEKTSWDSFVEYEEKIDSIISNSRMLALCTYSLEECSPPQIIEVVSNHQFSLIRKEGKWEKIESFGRKKVEEELKVSSEELQAKSEELQARSREIKEVNKAFQKSEDRYRTLAENSPDIIARFDRQKRHLYANRAAVEPYGRPAEEIIGKTNSELGMDPENVEFWETRYEKVFATGKPEIMEFHYISPQGKEYYFDTRIVPEFLDGKVDSVLAISRDITDAKKAEARLKETLDNLEKLVKDRTAEFEKAYISLKESERGLAEAQRMARLGNWEWNIISDELQWSDEIYRIFGRKPQEFDATYDAFLSYVHPDDKDYLDNAVKEAFKGIPYSIDHRIVLPEGEERIVHEEGEVLFDEKRNPVRMRGTVQEITELKKAEEKIQMLASAVESSDDAIIIKSLQGFVTSWNKGAEQVYGYTADEIMGQNVSILEPENVKGEIKKLDEKVKQGKKVRHYQTLRLRKDGTIINASITLSPVFDTYGRLIAISTVTRDITDIKKAEEMLRLKIEELARSNSELEQFAYVASHDLQEPLRMIASYLQLLQRKYRGQLDEKADKYIYFAVDGASRMQSLINDLLEFSRVTTKAGEIEPASSEAILKTVLSDLDLVIKEKGASVSYDPLPEIIADSTQIAQIFQNLISNAIKFRSEEPPQIHISAKQEKDYWLFSVKDNGIGIDPKYSERIFEVFKRLHKREEYPGTGIGLSICKKIVERHGGRIWVESEPGKGSTFCFTLPCNPKEFQKISFNT